MKAMTILNFFGSITNHNGGFEVRSNTRSQTPLLQLDHLGGMNVAAGANFVQQVFVRHRIEIQNRQRACRRLDFG